LLSLSRSNVFLLLIKKYPKVLCKYALTVDEKRARYYFKECKINYNIDENKID
jgi:hypothetical protein